MPARVRSPALSFTAEEVAHLRLDIDALLAPIWNYISSQAHSSFDRGKLLVDRLAVEETLVSLQLVADQMFPAIYDMVLSPLQAVENCLQAIEEAEEKEEKASLQQEWIKTETGQWKTSIPADYLVEIMELGFKDRDAALFLGCSERTIRRRRKELGLRVWNDDTISDDELAAVSDQIDPRLPRLSSAEGFSLHCSVHAHQLLATLRTMHSDAVGEIM